MNEIQAAKLIEVLESIRRALDRIGNKLDSISRK